MTVRRRGKQWAVEVYDPSKPSRKRYVGTFATQAEAKAAARIEESRVLARKGRRGDTTVAEFADRWLDLHPRQKESTNVAYAEQVKPFVARYGALSLRDVTVDLALEWALERRWTVGGIRAMFSDARRRGLVESNPFTGLRLRGSRGRKDIDVLSRAEIDRLVQSAHDVWTGEVAYMMAAVISMAAFVGMRPGELYGLRWSDIDLRSDEIHVERQYSSATRSFEVPKNGRARVIALTGPAKAALIAMPRPLDGEELVFRASRGGPMTGRVQHYYWHPVRCRFGRPSMDFYELRHFCASWLFNDLELPAQDVAHQLGHTDGGALVQRLYGHPSERLARERIKRAAGGKLASVTTLSQPSGHADRS